MVTVLKRGSAPMAPAAAAASIASSMPPCARRASASARSTTSTPTPAEQIQLQHDCRLMVLLVSWKRKVDDQQGELPVCEVRLTL